MERPILTYCTAAISEKSQLSRITKIKLKKKMEYDYDQYTYLPVTLNTKLVIHHYDSKEDYELLVNVDTGSYQVRFYNL